MYLMFKIAINTTLAALLITLTPTLSSAEFRYDTGNGGNVLFYGQFDPAYLSFDDGVSTTSTLADNTNSNSRIGLWYRQPTTTGQFAFNFETALGLRPTALVSQGFTPDAINWRRTSIRKFEAIWQSEKIGKFFIGQGSMSSDGAASQDLSGTTLVLYNSIPDTAGAFRFRTTAGALSTKTIGQSFGSYDGGRKMRLRYDTPSFGGITFSVSYGEEVLAKSVDQKVTDVGMSYARDFGGNKLVGSIAYSKLEFGGGTKRHDTIGSISYLHANGINVTFAAGNRNETGHYVYGKLGYRANWISAGVTSVAIDYYSGNDKTSVGSQSQSIGIGLVQSFDRQKIDAYLGYRKYSLEETGVTYRDASSVLFGARWKF